VEPDDDGGGVVVVGVEEVQRGGAAAPHEGADEVEPRDGRAQRGRGLRPDRRDLGRPEEEGVVREHVAGVRRRPVVARGVGERRVLQVVVADLRRPAARRQKLPLPHRADGGRTRHAPYELG